VLSSQPVKYVSPAIRRHRIEHHGQLVYAGHQPYLLVFSFRQQSLVELFGRCVVARGWLALDAELD
jgi:hypothetical protein